MDYIKLHIDEIIELRKNNQFKEALILAKRYANIYPHNHFIKFELAKLLVKFVETSELGKELLIDLLDSEYVSINAILLELGKLENMKGNFEKGTSILEKAIINNQDKDIFYLLSVLELSRSKIKLKEYETAEKLLNDNFLEECDKYDFEFGRMNLLILKIRQKDYQAAYHLFKQLVMEKSIPDEYISDLEFYLKKKLLLQDNQRKLGNYTGTYMSQQIFSYDWNRTLDHVEKHFSSECLDFDMFKNLDFDDMIPSSLSMLGDKYYVEIDESIFDLNGDSTNCIGLLTLANTSKIVSMFPADSNYCHYISKKMSSKEEVKINKLTRISQVDKFNRRYNK